MGVAVWIKVNRSKWCEDIAVAVTGLDSKPFRAKRVEDRLRGNKLESDVIDEASSQVTQGVDPLDDMHASAEFRGHLARVYTARAIQEATKRAGV